jgi:hypothetical protein
MSTLRKRLGLDGPARGAKPESPRPAEPAGKPGKSGPLPEASPDSVVTRSCGCRAGVRFLQGSKCPGCVSKARRQRQGKQKATQGRLPDGAAFLVIFDATAQQWTGTLTVGTLVFEDQAGRVFALLERLDALYRKAVSEVAG